MSEVLLGKPVQEKIASHLLATGKHPKLSIIQVGDNPRSNVYIGAKKRFAERVGAKVEHIRLDATLGESVVIDAIVNANADPEVHGIIVQLPLPEGFDREKIINSIDPRKDVDGLTPSSDFVPATALAVVNLLAHYGINPADKKVVVMGRSKLVGIPTAKLMEKLGAGVEVVHSQTPNPEMVTQKADILVVAIGKPEQVNEKFLVPGQVIVDVGINEVERGGKRVLVGDVLMSAKEQMSACYSPVPGGVGPITVASLFENLFTAYENLVQ